MKVDKNLFEKWMVTCYNFKHCQKGEMFVEPGTRKSEQTTELTAMFATDMQGICSGSYFTGLRWRIHIESQTNWINVTG